MSAGKLLNDSVLHAFSIHPRDVLRELIHAAKINRDKQVLEMHMEEWRAVTDLLIQAYNKAPGR